MFLLFARTSKMPTENKYEVNESIIRFYNVRAWSFGPRPVRQSCFTLDPPLGEDGNVELDKL